MTDEIRLEGLGVAQGVLETIITIAAEKVEGVACVCGQGLSGLVRKAGQQAGHRAVEVVLDESGAVGVALHVHLRYGTPLRRVAEAVQVAVADAVSSQIGSAVAKVDVFVDAVAFGEQ